LGWFKDFAGFEKSCSGLDLSQKCGSGLMAPRKRNCISNLKNFNECIKARGGGKVDQQNRGWKPLPLFLLSQCPLFHAFKEIVGAASCRDQGAV